ncbi:MAG TPA: L,D-transpeptidase [Bryobacteraceae bacterium]|nr:L,D-transpeptidase [Bryobacteraceae bacterium]
MCKQWSALLVIGVLITSVGADAKPKKRVAKQSATRNRVAEPPRFDAAAVNDPALTPANVSAATLKAQILLDRANFSPGEIDGRSGANFNRALSGFQEARKLPVSGKLDEATWAALNADATPAVTPYRITETDVAGPFVEEIPKDLVEQGKLKALGYKNALEALGEQFHVSPGLLTRMNPGAKFAAGEEIQVPNVMATALTAKAAKVVVSKAGWVRALDASGTILAQYPASSGSEHDPLPIGEWKIKGVAKNPPFHYNPELFWDADPSHGKAKIAPGPNNPVGVVWIDLSKEHYGIHGTPEPGNVGHTQSHGCIRLTNWDAMELAGMVGPNTPASLTE